jgi:hypothetical protein
MRCKFKIIYTLKKKDKFYRVIQDQKKIWIKEKMRIF